MFYQRYFLVTVPIFQLFLSGYGVENIGEVLVVDETMDVVVRGIGPGAVFTVLRNTGKNVIGETYV